MQANTNALDEMTKELRNEYMRKWRKANPDKVKAAQQRYWAKKAQEKKTNEMPEGDVI